MYKHDLALNNLQGLICRKTQPTNSFGGGGGEWKLNLHQIKNLRSPSLHTQIIF